MIPLAEPYITPNQRKIYGSANGIIPLAEPYILR